MYPQGQPTTGFFFILYHGSQRGHVHQFPCSIFSVIADVNVEVAALVAHVNARKAVPTKYEKR